jgi:hypothetical protein
MPYFPKSRIIENQKANPGEMQTPSGKEYTGPYYTTFDGKIFSGANPYSPGSRPLVRSLLNKNEDDTNISPDFNNDNYYALKPSNLAKLTDPTPYTPKPTDEDYRKGKITRYFARQRNGTQFKLMEIDQTTYDNLSNNRGGLNSSLWKVISIFWQISGPLRDIRVNNIRTRAGIIDTNQRVLDNAEKSFIGIKQYLTDLRQFSR